MEPVAEEVSGGLDVSAMAETLGKELFPSSGAEPKDDAPAETPVPSPTEAAVPSPQPTVRQAPASWPKDMHDYWGKTDPKVQEYWETREKQMMEGLNQYKTDADFTKQFRNAVAPYSQTLKQLGVDEITAARHLFNADHQLRYSPAEKKLEYFRSLAKEYGISLDGVNQQAAPIDPNVKAMQEKIERLEQGLTAREQAEQQAAFNQAAKEVEAFAADKDKHPYFEEVQDHITLLLHGMRAAGKQPSLQEAYDQAVWANPVTRAKEIAKAQTAHEAKLKENARLESLPKKKAAALNVNGRDTKRTPTEPLGTMEETLKKTYREIQERAH
jgi:hypothetical protein